MSWMRKRAPAQHRFRRARVGIKQKYLGRVGVAGKPCVRSGRVVLVGRTAAPCTLRMGPG